MIIIVSSIAAMITSTNIKRNQNKEVENKIKGSGCTKMDIAISIAKAIAIAVAIGTVVYFGVAYGKS